jgi:hypothetical protein
VRWRGWSLVAACRSDGQLTQRERRVASDRDLVALMRRNLSVLQRLAHRRDLVTVPAFPTHPVANSPGGLPAKRAPVRRGSVRRSSFGSAASRASGAGWRLCSPGDRRPWRSTSAGRDYADPDGITLHSTGICVVLFAASVRPPEPRIMPTEPSSRASTEHPSHGA